MFGDWDSLNSIAHIHTEVTIQRNSLIRQFTEYDQTKNAFIVKGDLVTPQKEGAWQIIV